MDSTSPGAAADTSPDEAPLREAGDRDRAEDWAFVLQALEIPSRVEPLADGRWALMVGRHHLAQAHTTLDDYDRERSERALDHLRPPPPAAEHGPSVLGVIIAGALLAFFVATGPRAEAPAWFAAGVASAERILHGEPWRLVTALTLHGDAAHVFGNAVGLLVLGNALGRWVGSGAAAWLILAAGTLGNAVNAFAYRSHHLSIGASTAVFGAVGLLAALGVLHRFRFGQRRMRALLPLAAGLALFGMLGVGEPGDGARIDVLAHLFGLAAGLATGFAAGPLLRRPPGRLGQGLLAATALAAVLLAWVVARGHGTA